MTNKIFLRAIITFIGILTISVFISYLFKNSFEDRLTLRIISKTIMIIITWIVIFKFKLFEKFKLSLKSGLLIVFSIVLIIISYFYVQNISVTINQTDNFKLLLGFVLVGIFEESLFRLFLFNTFNKKITANTKKKKLFKIIIITSFIFGLSHVLNLFNPAVYKPSIITLVFFAFYIGVFFQSLFLNTKSLIFVSTIHGLMNYFSSYKKELLDFYNNRDLPSLVEVFYSNLILLIIAIIIIVPISLLLIKKELK